MSTSLQIRPVGAADHAAWLPLWEGYQRFYRTEIAAATSDATWQRFLDADEPMNAALAWLDGRAVGLVHWIYHRSCWTLGDYCYLQDLFVAEGLRGEGVGRRLIEHVYAEAGAAGCSRVHWLTHESNSDAMKLYDRIADKSGFLQYRRIL
ncbi:MULTISPECIES: GNAT family N-acetyltransferase [Pseudomonas aeruginosa group]|uniref:GNAT family N-acetyltransferase n=1 Tax=Pseudomonas aeruginosa group TaxID=136841 RepID=UPI00053DEAF5|nr:MULTISPECIES: GNAT family N-acetyltransferase [Pseudomonas aeruginosa group]AVR70582.1 N-acetyltransferase [Pseudomonas paraeruginosa]KAB0751855.1 GNAT family N-acetyltransferase [Pseudomonas aeruginosa]KPD27734.1 GNAT family acetyltransferase [Pseudomonas paraeruginosa]KQB28064.1 GNAT family acetyltransferase [Pseudomonas paraeruginosa]KSR37636.1 N-acetyltransferase [Pseudomonas aeruginosa]